MDEGRYRWAEDWKRPKRVSFPMITDLVVATFPAREFARSFRMKVNVGENVQLGTVLRLRTAPPLDDG